MFNDILIFLGRFLIDVAICWVLYQFNRCYSLWQIKDRIRILNDETLAKHGPRKYFMAHIEKTIWAQERIYGEGEGCKQWFKDRFEEVSLFELAEWMGW